MLFFDTSALLKRYLNEEHSDWVAGLMSDDPSWAGSALLATEAAIGLGRGIDQSRVLAEVDTRLSRDLEFFDLAPVDTDCLVKAVELGRGYRLGTLDAVHLAATSAVPVDFEFITFDEGQRTAAEAMGLRVPKPPV